MPPGVSTQRFLLHPARAGAHGGRARSCSIADVLLPRRQPCAGRRGQLLVLVATLASLVPFADTRVEVAHGLLAVDNFALFFKVIFLVAAAIMTVLMSVRYLEIEGASARRVLLPDSVRHARHDDHGGRHRSHHDLHRPRDDGGVVLHPGGVHQAESAVERSGGEILSARRVLARHPAVRHVADVRAVGDDEPARDGGGVRRSGARSAAGARRSSWSWPAWVSRSRRCRSTCGRPTCTKARRRRSRRFCRWDRRPRRSRCCCGFSSKGCRR